jgi:FMN phosphatase YigB (HAD superfamily)
MIDTVIYDTDDTKYPVASGLHSLIKARICAHANSAPAIRARAREWLGEDRDFGDADLGRVFPLIVEAQHQDGRESLTSYLDAVYDLDYGMIVPDPRLIGALEQARARGLRLMDYTNGPSSPVPGEDFHVQKVLRRLGADDDLVETLRPETYDLLKSIAAGAGKPTVKGLADFLGAMKVDPRRSLMIDDDPRMGDTARGAGMDFALVRTPGAPPVSLPHVTHAAEPLEALLRGACA